MTMTKYLILLSLIGFLNIHGIAQTDVIETAKKKIQANDFKTANSDLTTFLQTNPKNKTALTVRGQARIGMEEFYGAIGNRKFAMEQDTIYSDALSYRGEAKMNLDDDDGAIIDFNKAIKFNPKLADAYTNRGLAKYNTEDLQGAYFDFSKALE